MDFFFQVSNFILQSTYFFEILHNNGNNELRRVKADRKDAVKLANYDLDRWFTLPRYIPEEDTRLLLKNCYRQYRQYSKVQTVLKNNLISLLDTVFPNASRLFSGPIRGDGSEKWVDFVAEFWHCRCVSEKSELAFTSKYQRWCRKHGYNFSEAKAHTIYTKASGHIGVMPKSETTKLLVEQAVSQLRATSAAPMPWQSPGFSIILFPKPVAFTSIRGIPTLVVLRAANQDGNDCQWQSYLTSMRTGSE